MLVLLANPASAVEWKFSPSVGAQAIYTDNANQSHNDPHDALILAATPGFSLQSQGSRRLQASMSYGLTGVARFGNDNSTDLNHHLGANGKAELIEDFLFLDASASISQELISLLGSPADATINSSNRATVGTYSISPYIQKRLGNFANAQARYTTGGAIFGNNVASNIYADSFSAGLTSGTYFNDLSWGLDYSYRNVSANGTGTIDNSYTYERADLSLGYALTRTFRLIGNVGQEWVNYKAAIAADRSDSIWSAGFGWSPSRRTSIEATVGERFFGHTYSLSGSYRARQSYWTVNYSEDLSDISQLTPNFNDLKGVQFSCPGAVLPPNPSLSDLLNNPGCNVTNLFFGTSLTNNVFIAKLLTAGVSWELTARTSLSLELSDLTREFLVANQGQDRVQTATGTIYYRLSAQTSASGSLSLSRNSVDSVGSLAQVQDDLLNLSLSLNHQFDPKLSGALTLRHQQRDANDSARSYDENSIMASAFIRF